MGFLGGLLLPDLTVRGAAAACAGLSGRGSPAATASRAALPAQYSLHRCSGSSASTACCTCSATQRVLPVYCRTTPVSQVARSPSCCTYSSHCGVLVSLSQATIVEFTAAGCGTFRNTLWSCVCTSLLPLKQLQHATRSVGQMTLMFCPFNSLGGTCPYTAC